MTEKESILGTKSVNNCRELVRMSNMGSKNEQQKQEVSGEEANPVDAIVSQSDLMAFADYVLGMCFDGIDVDGDDIQEIGIKTGLLQPVYPTEPCGEECKCQEVWNDEDFKNKIVLCYQKTY